MILHLGLWFHELPGISLIEQFLDVIKKHSEISSSVLRGLVERLAFIRLLLDFIISKRFRHLKKRLFLDAINDVVDCGIQSGVFLWMRRS